MKNQFAQIVSLVTKFDHRYLQIAYIAAAVLAAVVLKTPSDGGTGPY